MTLLINIGRRVPRNWYRRQGSKVKGLMTFQEHIWNIIVMSIKKSRKAAVKDGRMKFNISNETEPEDLHYQLEWMNIIIQGTPEMEKEEYEDTKKVRDKIGIHFKKDYDVDKNLSKMFKTKIMSMIKLQDCYDKGRSELNVNSIENKLLEMGILFTYELIDDYDTRDEVIV